MNKEANKNFNIVKSLLFWTGAIICFVLFPIFLLDIGLQSYINTKNEIEEREAYRKLGLSIEKILQYNDAKHYYHSLLKKIFDIAESQSSPVDYLKVAIPHLKERNPGIFNFIVWNSENEEIIENLTDENEHRYVLKSLKEVFKTVSDENNKKYPVDPNNLSLIKKKTNIVRSYIGNFFVPDTLLKPLLRGNLGKIALVSSNREKSYFWFYCGKKITMMVTVNRAALESYDYVDKLIKGLNNSPNGGVKFGFSDLINNKFVSPEFNESRIAELNVALAKYENYSNAKLSTNNYLITIKILNPFIRVFCYIPKSFVFKNQNLRQNSLIIALLIVSLFFIGLWIVYKFTTYNFSMSWKLSCLFLYANGLPLIVLGFIGYDYLQQNRNIQLIDTYDNISQFLRDFDLKFGLIKVELASKFNKIVDYLNSGKADKESRQKYYDLLKKEIAETDYYDFNVIDTDGNNVVINNNINDSFVTNTGKDILKFMNNATYTPRISFARENDETRHSLNNMYKNGIFIDDIVSKKGVIVFEQVIDKACYYYFNFIGNTQSRKYDNMLVISWLTYQLQEKYVKTYISDLNNNSRNIKCLAFSSKFGKFYPEDWGNESELLGCFSQVINLKSLSFDKVTYKGKDYVAFGFVGKESDQIAFLGLFPLDIINDKINKNWWRLIFFIIISLSLTFGVSWVLSASFLEPIKDLRGGIEAMGQQKFTYRLPIKSADEFGALNQVFNSALESLEDLSVATTVQENLFPLEPLKQNKAFVWGKSVTMTRLGGDYFDFFPLSDKEVGVLMGDVAGHGVPAGFLMAMAKASVILSEEDKKTPSKLLSAIHKVFYHVKSKKIKRMMTCVYFCINTETGEFSMANAGHCYPAFISKDRKVSFLEIDGTPLGITKRARYTNTEGKLNDCSFMLLYTDGMLEAHNEAGESIGIQRFSELISNSYSEDPEIYYKQIFAGYKKWSPLADDDITMVLVKFGFDAPGIKEVNTNLENNEVVI